MANRLTFFIVYCVLWKSRLHGFEVVEPERPLKEGSKIALHCKTEEKFWVQSEQKIPGHPCFLKKQHYMYKTHFESMTLTCMQYELQLLLKMS